MSKVAWDYIVPVKLPADLKGVEPGKLPANLLRPVPGGGKMHWIAACAWTAMVEKAKADGVELKPTSAGDTYREYELQKRGFLQRHQTEPIAGVKPKDFEGKKWYLKKGQAPLATPGKSQHNLGLAVDVHSAAEPKRIKWLIDNVKTFGFSWEVVPQEPWHLRYVCGDTPPPAVVAYMEKNGVTKPVASAAPAAPAKTPATKPAAAKPAGDTFIKELQEKLKEKGFYKGPITGIKNPKTDEAIKNFKVANGLPADSIPGPKVKELLGIA